MLSVRIEWRLTQQSSIGASNILLRFEIQIPRNITTEDISIHSGKKPNSCVDSRRSHVHVHFYMMAQHQIKLTIWLRSLSRTHSHTHIHPHKNDPRRVELHATLWPCTPHSTVFHTIHLMLLSSLEECVLPICAALSTPIAPNQIYCFNFRDYFRCFKLFDSSENCCECEWKATHTHTQSTRTKKHSVEIILWMFPDYIWCCTRTMRTSHPIPN